MIYQPVPVFDLRVAIGIGIVDALFAAAGDFIAEDNKPWTYYAGVGLGGTIGATGIKEAVATAYVLCNQLDITLWKSPEGSLVRCYVDGLLQATIDAYSGTAGTLIHTLNLANNVKHRIDLVNGEPSPSNTSGISWMGIGDLQIDSGFVQQKGMHMTTDILSFGIVDADGDKKTLPVYIPSGLTLAQMQTFADDLAPKLHAVIDGEITDITATFSLSIAAGAAGAAVAGSEVQKGVLLDFVAADTQYVHGVYVPTWKNANFSGNEINLAGTGVSAFIAEFTTGATPALPSDRYGNDLTSLKKGTKRFRK